MLSTIETTVVNTSGARRYFDFLPPYGVTLNEDQEYSFTGSLVEASRRKGTNLPREQQIKSMRYALDNDLISVKQTPSPVFYDDTAGKAMRLQVDDGTLLLAEASNTPGVPVLVGPAPEEPEVPG